MKTSEFAPIGLKIWNGETSFSFSILCEDLTSQSRKIVSISFEEKQDLKDLRIILKRLEVVLLGRGIDSTAYDWSEIDNEMMIDDRPE